MAEEILRVQSRRAARQRRGQIAQHVFAAIILITAAVDHLQHANSILAIFEFAAGALLLGSVIRERLHRASHGSVAWVELAGAVMTLVEAIERTRGRHHLSFIILSFIPPAILLFFAVFDSQIASARYLKASDDFFEARLRLLFRRRVAWKEVRGFRVDGHTIVVDVDDRTRKIRLRDVVDRDAALTWSAEQFRRRGIAESVPQ